VVVAALLLALGAYLAGRPRWLTAAYRGVRRVTTTRDGGRAWRVWVARHADAIWIATIVLAVLVLFFTGIDWVPVAVVGAVLALVRWQISAARRTVAEDGIQASSPREERAGSGSTFGPRPATPTRQP
jgi:hypothetical protein